MYLYKFHQLITYYNAKYSSAGRISASNLVSSDLTPKLSVYIKFYKIQKLYIPQYGRYVQLDWLASSYQ